MSYGEFIPREVVQTQEEPKPIYLFVRNETSMDYLYVGQLQGASRWGRSGRDSHGEAHLPLNPPLPSKVWVELGGLKLGDLAHSAIDAVLDRLRGPTTVEDRLQVLERLVTYWHGEIRPEDGFGDDELKGLPMPPPLRWLYRWAGRRQKILSGQNTLLDPGDLRVKDNLLVFYGENQWCYEWGTRLDGDDPPVYGRRESAEPWEAEGIVLSEHLILACLFEAIFHSPYGASVSWLERSNLDRIIETIPPLNIAPWHWGGEGQFYAKAGAFLFTMKNYPVDEGWVYSAWIGAKTEHPLQFLKPMIDKSWEYVGI
jgi:hypothetical protein